MKKFIIPAIAAGVVVVAVVIITVIAVSQKDVYRLIKVNSFEGAVTVQREEKMDAFEGLQLVSEDLVEVGNQSLLELLADSDKHIVAEADTAFRLHSTGTETSGNITIDLLYGKSLFTIENKLSEESFFSVKTPNATLSVRGTTFEVSYDPQTETTVVEVTEGIVAVVSDVLTDDLTAGESAVIRNEETVESTEPTEEVTVETQQANAETAETAETAESMLEPLFFEHTEDVAFNIRYSDLTTYSGLHAKHLNGWITPLENNNVPFPSFDSLNDKSTLMYMALTADEAQQKKADLESKGYKIHTLVNGDGDTIEVVKFNYSGVSHTLPMPDGSPSISAVAVNEQGYEYFKKVTDDLYLSISVSFANKEQFETTDINSYIQLTEDEFYILDPDITDQDTDDSEASEPVTPPQTTHVIVPTPVPAPQTTPAPVLVPVPEEEYPDDSSTGGLVTIPLAEFESDYVEEIIELTAENASEYFEAAEYNGSLYFALKPGYASYGDGYNVETDYVSFSTTALGGSRYNFTLSEDEDIQKQMNINRASGSIVKYNIPDDMWFLSGNDYIVFIKYPDSSIYVLER
ncbi:MAG: FecR domain-containing protein [Oscillospiraceae bacterium]|nr:FecR domain-containing protein [Oscillospiraceae bacterium]